MERDGRETWTIGVLVGVRILQMTESMICHLSFSSNSNK